MPLANKEVVHLKTGWEKIQVRDLLFTTLLSKVRSSLSLSLFFFLSFFYVSMFRRRRCNNNNKMRSETEISLLSERILKCV